MAAYIATHYLRTVSPPAQRVVLKGEMDCDACVVGGGFTGLSAALRLADAGMKVVLLEAKRVGWGASGRNAGHILNGFRRDPLEVIREAAEDLRLDTAAMLFRGPELIRRNIRRFGLDADYRAGTTLTAVTAREHRELQKISDLWGKEGHRDFDLLEGGDVERIVRANRGYRAVLHDRAGGHFNPLKYCLGLADNLESLGVHIFEDSQVLGIERNGDFTIVNLEGGCVRAKHAILCGNAYLGQLSPFLARRSLVAGSSQIVTEPVGQDLLNWLLPAGASIEEGALDAHYYRPLPDGRLIFGAGLDLGAGSQRQMIDRIRPRLEATLPQLKGVGIDIAWSCNFLVTRSHLPLVGRLAGGPWYAMGYNAFGVAFSHVAGTAVADEILGESPAYGVLSRVPNGVIPASRSLRFAYVLGAAAVAHLAGAAGRIRSRDLPERPLNRPS